MQDAMTIRRAKADELEAIFALLRNSKLPLEGLQAHLSSTLVAERGGGLIGSAALEMYGSDALLRSVAVSESLRGAGLGRRLTQAALDLARNSGIKNVYLLTETARDFFPRFGFRTITREDVPALVKTSVEFQSVCPASATVMVCKLESQFATPSLP